MLGAVCDTRGLWNQRCGYLLSDRCGMPLTYRMWCQATAGSEKQANKQTKQVGLWCLKSVWDHTDVLDVTCGNDAQVETMASDLWEQLTTEVCAIKYVFLMHMSIVKESIDTKDSWSLSTSTYSCTFERVAHRSHHQYSTRRQPRKQ